jgi:hypothetical protein
MIELSEQEREWLARGNRAATVLSFRDREGVHIGDALTAVRLFELGEDFGSLQPLRLLERILALEAKVRTV